MNRAYTETPVVFGRDHSLVGIVCRPAVAASERPFVVFLNAGIIHRSGPNRMSTRIARGLAHIGVSSLRFDLSGIGDSVVPPSAAAMSIRDRVVIDIDDALAFARDQFDATTFILGGLCSGADNAMRTAARCSDVVGLVLLDLNVARTRGYYLRLGLQRLRSREAWVHIATGRHPLTRRLRRLFRRNDASAAACEPEQLALPHDAIIPRDEMRVLLHQLLARDVQFLCVFTAGLEAQYNYERQFLDLFPDVRFGDRLRLHYFGDSDHSFTGPALQERLRRTVVSWVSEAGFRDAEGRAASEEPARARRYSLTPRSRLRRLGRQPASE